MREHVTPRRLRLAFVTVLVVCAASVAYGAVTDSTAASDRAVSPAPPTDNHTVVTQSGRIGNIIAYAPNGSVLYFNDSHTKYYDVDPVENESMTVEYTATDTLFTESPRCRDPPCARNIVERANLSTGEVTQVYVRYDYRETVGEWHDADRVDDRHIVVADMVADQVFVVDTETEMIEWTWEVQSEFPVDEGGPYPGNWVHLNDVEVLDDGRVMVSLRNQDQVVFIDPETGMQENMTLGEEDNYSILHEQHNPDYVPEERGGPAVVVSDSQNGRVQEFQRENGSWTRTWEWSDQRMQWPRDADRLPNGNTLVTDTGGERVVEVNESGDIVWQVELPHPYDAERLETGDESAGGQSAAVLDLESRTNGGGDDGREINLGLFEPVIDAVRDLLPTRLESAIINFSPPWLHPSELDPVIVALVTAAVWGGVELWWFLRSRGVRFRSPVYRREE